ncbi:MAG: mobile mystery protein B [Alphaproteobacteria bacterium]|nr:mobile mystery protein B [Alphaproteobacteria bacterium]
MSGPFDAGDDATPLTAEERNGLVPSHVTLRRELNELEQQNILEADQWAFGRRRNVLDLTFLRGLHRRMFNHVWKWAGEYRTSERNLGIESYRIETELYRFLGDVRYWIENGAYLPDEIAVRYHHCLVSIHPFPNGNGRWSRLAADLLIVQRGGKRFTWGRANLQAASAVRKAYIDALHAADRHDLAPLVAFTRS